MQKSDTFLRVGQVAEMFSVTKQTVWNWCNQTSPYRIPDFPNPIKISPKATVFSLNELIAFQEKRKSSRETKQAEAVYENN